MKRTNVSGGRGGRRDRRGRRRGQGLTEYVIIVGLTAILLIGAVTRFKEALGNAYEKAGTAIEENIAKKIR